MPKFEGGDFVPRAEIPSKMMPKKRTNRSPGVKLRTPHQKKHTQKGNGDLIEREETFPVFEGPPFGDTQMQAFIRGEQVTHENRTSKEDLLGIPQIHRRKKGSGESSMGFWAGSGAKLYLEQRLLDCNEVLLLAGGR